MVAAIPQTIAIPKKTEVGQASGLTMYAVARAA